MTVAWTLTPLRYLVDRIESGTSVNAADVPAPAHDLGVLKTSCVSLGRFVPSENKQVNDDERDRVTCPVLPGRLIVSRMNTPSLVGAAGFTDTAPANLFLPDRLWQVSTKSSDAKFLYWWMQSQEFRDQVKLICVGTSSSMQNLSQGDFLSFTLTIPSVSHQRTVAHFLDRETAQIDDLIGKQERLVELLAEKRQAVITQAVTKGLDPNAPTKPSGIPWLGSVPTHWTVMTINRLASVISKGTTPTTMGAEFTDQGVRFLKAENIQNNQAWDTPANFISADTNRLLARSQLQVDDLLVVIAGATTGKSAVLLRALTPSNTNQAVAFVRPRDPLMSKWIHHVLSTQRVQSLISSLSVQSAQPNLSMGDLGKIWVTVPPPVEIDLILSQTSRAVEKLDSLTMMARRAVELLRERRSALISAAVTGKIDVHEGVA